MYCLILYIHIGASYRYCVASMSEENRIRLNWPVFIISFAIGFLYVYLSSPPKKMVLKYPNPYNAGKIVYHDKSDTCFVFDAVSVDCPKDDSKVKPQPIITS